MQHDKDKGRKPASRPEFEVAYYTRELGRPLQRKMLERQLAGSSDSPPASGSHGEDISSQADGLPPKDDRAG
jgi:hypothetical protein